MKRVVVIGNGGHARSCVDAWDPGSGDELVGCTGTDPAQHGQLAYLGTDDVLPGLIADGVRHAFVALGPNALRAKVSADLAGRGLELVELVAPTARVSPTATLGAGCAVLHGAVVGAYARIGSGAIINTAASVDHDCEIGDYAHLAPGTHLAGTVSVGAGAFLGVGVSVIPGVNIGADAVVGAGAVVIEDVPPGATVHGVPARSRQEVG